MLKAPPLKSSDLHFSVIKCHCWTYDDNIGPKFKKPSFAILGLYIIESTSLQMAKKALKTFVKSLPI